MKDFSVGDKIIVCDDLITIITRIETRYVKLLSGTNEFKEIVFFNNKHGDESYECIEAIEKYVE